ncbi:MAG TPA: cyclase family protein [Dehalococcoidia bacterium]
MPRRRAEGVGEALTATEGAPFRRAIDITRVLRSGMATWPGEPGPELAPLKSMAAGDPADVSRLSLGVHTGTHVDAPRHFIAGESGVEALALSALIGPATVVDIEHPGAIRISELEGRGLENKHRLLFRTRNSLEWSDEEFKEDFVYLEPDAAAWLAQYGALLVGVDYLSVEGFTAEEALTHRTLLGEGVVVLEGLDLREVPPGDYYLVALPLRLLGSDGAPARAILLTS